MLFYVILDPMAGREKQIDTRMSWKQNKLLGWKPLVFISDLYGLENIERLTSRHNL